MPLKDRLNFDKDPVYLIDGTALLYRSFYARSDLTRSDGFPTGAINTTLRSLFNLLKNEQPKYVAFLMDGKGPTFRNELYDLYKANRPAMPENLAAQIDPVREGVKMLGVTLIVSDGVEADDCIAALANKFKAERPVVIVASDKDLKQCLDKNVCILNQAGRKEKIITLESFREEEGMEPNQWPDFQALIGDSSDNIPGIPKVGPVTAKKIMADFPTLEDLREGYESLPPKLREKVEPELENIFTYRELTRMKLDCCDDELSAFSVSDPDREALRDFLLGYELRSLAAAVPAPADQPAKAPKKQAEPSGATQLSLFGTAPEPVKDLAPLEVVTVADADALPDFDNADVGLCPVEGGFRIGLGKKEYFYKNEAAPLAERLGKARLLATPSLQELIRHDTCWADIPSTKWYDLSLAAYLLDPEARGYGWDRLKQSLHAGQDFSHVTDDLHPDADGLAALAYMKGVMPQVDNAKLGPLMRDLEIPLIPVLVAMERAGVAIDNDAFNGFLEEVSGQLSSLTRDIIDKAGEEFNIRSSQQLATVLFDTLGLKPAGKTAGGQLSTANTVLEKIRDQHPIVEDILEYRMLEKLRSTYLEPLPKLAAEDGRIHTHFNQLATATGRLSSSRPNLQNIPIRGKHGKRMRACFTAEKGNLLAAADYSQIELRVLAHFSADPALVDAFNNDADIHTTTAALLSEKTNDDVTPEERRNAKTVNFGLIYGMGPQKLARELGITMNEAKEFIERYFEKLATLKGFYESIIHDAEEHGFVTTLAGRRRLLPELHSRNNQVISQARRQAVNTVIQGSAADIIKMAMIKAHQDETLRDLDAQLILQVHDELVLEVPEKNARKAGERIQQLMQNTADLNVPLKVDLGIGVNWAEAH
ncbi:DNA polymerase I [Salidesulfovibrio brasiliensis]|uniref:DNA polymerase I n=1 Tax=Salidesulfovibrio brasiliensis TaxID=221711 RepID=UPI0006CF31DC|nr:DNA polymerase I [Salidesulfovibrio brasiliensis]